MAQKYCKICGKKFRHLSVGEYRICSNQCYENLKVLRTMTSMFVKQRKYDKKAVNQWVTSLKVE